MLYIHVCRKEEPALHLSSSQPLPPIIRYMKPAIIQPFFPTIIHPVLHVHVHYNPSCSPPSYDMQPDPPSYNMQPVSPSYIHCIHYCSQPPVPPPSSPSYTICSQPLPPIYLSTLLHYMQSQPAPPSYTSYIHVGLYAASPSLLPIHPPI